MPSKIPVIASCIFYEDLNRHTIGLHLLLVSFYVPVSFEEQSSSYALYFVHACPQQTETNGTYDIIPYPWRYDIIRGGKESEILQYFHLVSSLVLIGLVNVSQFVLPVQKCPSLGRIQ